jgi:hypothetical protein
MNFIHMSNKSAQSAYQNRIASLSLPLLKLPQQPIASTSFVSFLACRTPLRIPLDTMNRCHRSLPLSPSPISIRTTFGPPHLATPPPRKTQRLGCRRSVPLALQRLDAPPESTPNFEPCHDCSVTCSPLCFSHDHFFYSPLLRRQSSGHPTLRLAAATAAPVQAQAQHCA